MRHRLIGSENLIELRSSLSSDCGFNVLVQPKQIGRIVLVLERDEPSIVGAVGGPNARCFLSVKVIDINFAGCEGFHCRPERTGPLDLMC